MKKEIENRVIELGGKCNFQKKSLHDDLMSILFDKSFLFKNFWDFIPDKHWKGFESKLLERGSVSDEEVPCVHFEFEIYLYTPFKPGTADYEEEYSGYLDECQDYTKSIIKSDISEFMVIGHMDMERYFVSLSDENPENPTVYQVDLDAPFSECTGITIEGTFEGFLNNLLSPIEYQKVIEEYIKEVHSK